MKTQDYRIEFEQMEWQPTGQGVEQKEILHDGQRMRMVRFSIGFREENWCRKAHVGYVVDGSMTINFNGRQQSA